MGAGLQEVAYGRTVGIVSAASAFERNMTDDMQRTGTLRRSADGGYVGAFLGDRGDVSARLAKVIGLRFRGRADGQLAIVEFPSFALFMDGSMACEAVTVPDDAFLDFSEVAEGAIIPDPESEMALHAVFSALDRLVVGRPVPDAPDVHAQDETSLSELRSEMASDLPGLLAALGGKLRAGTPGT